MKEIFIELRKVIEDMREPLIRTISLSMHERSQEVADILATWDSLADFFALSHGKDIGNRAYLSGLHICNGVARNIAMGSEENIHWQEYNELFINGTLDAYVRECDEVLQLI